jgi:hypothetical protein
VTPRACDNDEPLDDDYVPMTAAASSPRRRRPAVEPETAITKRVLGWLNTQPNTYAWKLHTSAMGEGGHPDIDGCVKGRCLKIEMKKPGERPDARQMGRLLAWREAGALVGWATSLDEARDIFNMHKDPLWRNPLTAPGAGVGRAL